MVCLVVSTEVVNDDDDDDKRISLLNGPVQFSGKIVIQNLALCGWKWPKGRDSLVYWDKDGVLR